MTAQAGAVASLAERRALNKALDALDALSEAWAEEVNLTALCANLAKAADVPAAIRAMVVQAWVEGAYAGRTSHTTTPSHAGPMCPDCGSALLLYECVGCSATNYPAPPAAVSVEALEGLLDKAQFLVDGLDEEYVAWPTRVLMLRAELTKLTQLIKERSNG